MKAILDQLDFEISDWPGNSPDLNPIGNCWNHMKDKLKNMDIPSLPKLKDTLLKLWTQDLNKEYLASFSAECPGGLLPSSRTGVT
jgi:hypothetical protein